MLYRSIGLLPELTKQRIDLADRPTNPYQVRKRGSRMGQRFTILYQPRRPIQNHQVITPVMQEIPYQSLPYPIVAQPRPQEAFTNAYHLDWIKYKYEHIL